ncbi:MAG: GlsB/YeaQ/YmgE family stress response membrane protein [Pseudomonadota bacterium]
MDMALMDIGGGVGFFGTLLIGGLAGWIAEKLTKARHGLITNIVLGILGAYVGAFLANALGIRLGEIFQGWFWGNLIVAAAGAVVLILGYRLITSKNK